jgi:type IX secretion system PorP/SprF family membrane protein
MNMKKSTPHILFFFLVASLCVSLNAGAQDIHFSQFYETPLLRNPALAGIFTGDYRIQTVYRDQWNSFTDAYRTGSLSGEYKWPIGKQNDYFTTGLEVLWDKSGSAALETTELLPALNYHKSLSNDRPMYLSLGFMGGLVEKTLDLSKVTTNSQYNGYAYDPDLPNGETILSPNTHYLDGSLGISFNTAYGPDNQNSLYFGFAYHHLNRPKNSFYDNPAVELDPKVVISFGLKSIINDYSYFTLQGDWSRQGPDQETIGGVMYSYKLSEENDYNQYTFTIGGLVRWKDAFIPVIKLEMNSFTMGLSYDVNTSALSTVSDFRGGFELSLSYTGILDHENPKYRTLCPRF